MPPHFIYEIKTIGDDVIGVHLFHLEFMRFHLKIEVTVVPTILLALINAPMSVRLF